MPEEEKKLKERANKAIRPEENKDGDLALTPNPSPAGRGEMVKIKFRPNRAAEGVEVDANGCAFVSASLADYLVGIGYADYEK